MDCLLDWYERRRELRRKGWVNLRDQNGHTALMMAAMQGYVEIMHILLLKNANIHLKDLEGNTARDLAVARNRTAVVEFIDEWLHESDEEAVNGEGNNIIDSGLTSTQRNKIKKREMMAHEQRGVTKSAAVGEDSEEEEEPELSEIGPAPIWPEVAKVVESVEMLRPICEISIQREKPEVELSETNGFDPALWHLRYINRLEVHLAPGIMTKFPGDDLFRLRRLQTLILSGNSLTVLPNEISALRYLKVLEVSHNSLVELPSSIDQCKKLKTIDVSFNELSDLKPLMGLTNLGSLQVSGNKLTSLDLNYANLDHLYDLQASNNFIQELPSGIGQLLGLTQLVAENNRIVALPDELTALKKIKVLKLLGNPIKDQKVVKMLREDQRKDLWKYLDKIGVGGKRGQKGEKKNRKIKNSTGDDSLTYGAKCRSNSENYTGYDTDDSFDITMEEL